MYVGILEHPDLKKTSLKSFKIMTSGGSSLPVEVLNKFKELTGVNINEGFGMTETSPQTHLNPYKGVSKVGSIGIRRIRIPMFASSISETGKKEVPAGEEGEMIFRGPQITKGYLNKPETRKAIRNGWLYSGDIAYMDEDGYFFIVDRKRILSYQAATIFIRVKSTRCCTNTRRY